MIENLFQCIFIGIFLSLIALITTVGNLFVIFAFYYDQKLRTINGKILVSLFVIFFVFFERLFYIKYGYCGFFCGIFLYSILYSIQVCSSFSRCV